MGGNEGVCKCNSESLPNKNSKFRQSSLNTFLGFQLGAGRHPQTATYTCGCTCTSVADEEKDLWMVDSGANICVTDPMDPIILKVFNTTSALRTTQGVVKSKRAILKTPVGPRLGLLVKGSGRIIPEAAFGEAADGF